MKKLEVCKVIYSFLDCVVIENRKIDRDLGYTKGVSNSY